MKRSYTQKERREETNEAKNRKSEKSRQELTFAVTTQIDEKSCQVPKFGRKTTIFIKDVMDWVNVNNLTAVTFAPFLISLLFPVSEQK